MPNRARKSGRAILCAIVASAICAAGPASWAEEPPTRGAPNPGMHQHMQGMQHHWQMMHDQSCMMAPGSCPHMGTAPPAQP